MNLIRIEPVGYDYEYKESPTKGEIYLNPSFIAYIEKRCKRTSENKERFFYVIRLRDGGEISVSEQCYNRIVGLEPAEGRTEPQKTDNENELKIC